MTGAYAIRQGPWSVLWEELTGLSAANVLVRPQVGGVGKSNLGWGRA